MVRDLKELEGFPYAGHGALLGKEKRPWQDVGYVLGQFGGGVTEARRRYRAYVKEGIGQGRQRLVPFWRHRALSGQAHRNVRIHHPAASLTSWSISTTRTRGETTYESS